MRTHLLGVHDESPDWVQAAQKASPETAFWCVDTIELGSDINAIQGQQFNTYNGTVQHIVRLNYHYGQENGGTIPPIQQQVDFALCVQKFVRLSSGANIFIIGNEWSIEYPLNSAGDLRQYVATFSMCRNLIKVVLPDAIVIPQAVAPWNDRLGGWLEQHRDMLAMLGPDGCDGIAIHAYTHGNDPGLINSDAKMQPPYDNCHYEWPVYQDFLNATPANMRHLPCWITEANPNGWDDEFTGWIAGAIDNIAAWNNQSGTQKILGVILYRWFPYHEGYCCNLPEVVRAMELTWMYNWFAPESLGKPAPINEPRLKRMYVEVAQRCNLRETPGLDGKKLTTLEIGTLLTINNQTSGPSNAKFIDGLWWRLVNDGVVGGWCAESAPNGLHLLEAAQSIGELASEYGVDVTLAQAVLQVESGGDGFVDGKLKLRFENHLMAALLPKETYAQCFRNNPQRPWTGHYVSFDGGVNWVECHTSQAMEHRVLEFAATLTPLAYNCASYGAAQILGINYAAVGYPSARAMMEAFAVSRNAQNRAFFEFCKNKGLIAHLRSGDLYQFAVGYNGPGSPDYYVQMIENARRSLNMQARGSDSPDLRKRNRIWG